MHSQILLYPPKDAPEGFEQRISSGLRVTLVARVRSAKSASATNTPRQRLLVQTEQSGQVAPGEGPFGFDWVECSLSTSVLASR